MAELTTEDLRMRQFLLGELDEKEREELEQLVLSEGNTRDKLSMAEDDLIEEYLEGSLQGDARERFLCEFLSIPHQRNKLRIAKSLRRFAREGELEPVEAHPVPEPHALPFYRNPLVYVPAAAAVVVAVTIGAVWYAQYRGNIARENRRQEIERELAQLNRAGEPNLPVDQVSTIIVLPFSPRSVVASSSSNLQSRVLELWLIPGTGQSETYEALLEKVGSQDKFRIPNLRLQERASNAKAVRLKIPTHLLTPGTYKVRLTGLSADGKTASPSEYNFEIQ
jgi:hypothetical protein